MGLFRNRYSKPKKRITVDDMAERTVRRSLQFSKHMTQFSKIVSTFLMGLYGLTWVAVMIIMLHDYFINNTFDTSLLEFTLSPVTVVLTAYFGSKVMENCSNIVMQALIKKWAQNNNLDIGENQPEGGNG